MKDVLMYKGFIGSVHFDAEDQVFHGKIEGINDLVTFEGDSVKDITRAFHEAVDDYVLLCKEAGKKPLKSARGSFNVRISPEIHQGILEIVSVEHTSLNQFVERAIEKEVEEKLVGFKTFLEGVQSNHPLYKELIAKTDMILSPQTIQQLKLKRVTELRDFFNQFKGSEYEEKFVELFNEYLNLHRDKKSRDKALSR